MKNMFFEEKQLISLFRDPFCQYSNDTGSLCWSLKEKHPLWPQNLRIGFAPQHLRDLPAELDHLKGNPQNWSSIESRSRPHFPTYNASRNASTTSVQEVEQSRLRLNTVEAYQS